MNTYTLIHNESGVIVRDNITDAQARRAEKLLHTATYRRPYGALPRNKRQAKRQPSRQAFIDLLMTAAVCVCVVVIFGVLYS